MSFCLISIAFTAALTSVVHKSMFCHSKATENFSSNKFIFCLAVENNIRETSSMKNSGNDACIKVIEP